MNEPIQVDTMRDKRDRVIPVAFIWDDTTYKVVDWGRRWRKTGREHMLVRSDGGETFEIAYEEHDASWRLLRQLRTPRGPSRAA